MANRTRLPKLWYVALVAFAVALPTPLFAQGLAQQIGAFARSLQASDRAQRFAGSRLAITQFSSDPTLVGFGAFLRASLQDRFAAGAHYDLLSDAQVSDALTRLKLQAGAALSPDDVKHLGKEAAAALVLTGAITNGAGAVTISAALVHAASGEELSKARIEISKALIPDEYLQVSEIEQFRPPSTHPLHEGEAFQIAMLCRTRTPVDLKALQGALPPAPCSGDMTADGQYLRILYGEKDPIAAWVSLRGGILIASSASAKSLASFRSMDDHLQTILEEMGKQNKKLTSEQRVKLLCFGTTYFAAQPESYLRMIFGERELAHFVARGTLYIPPDMKVLDARATSLFRGWDGGFGFTLDNRTLDPKTAKAGDYLSLTSALTKGIHQFEASTYLSRDISGPQPGIGMLEILCTPGEKPLMMTVGKGDAPYYAPVGALDAVIGPKKAPPVETKPETPAPAAEQPQGEQPADTGAAQ
jgi:hypothetical protein